MHYSKRLEDTLRIRGVIDNLESAFDSQDYNTDVGTDINLLRQIKLFLSEHPDSREAIVKGSAIDSTDCLTIAIMANTLAARKGLRSRIVRPKNLARYFHAMLLYDLDNNGTIFKLTGRPGTYSYKILSPENVKFRLGYFRPIINFVNTIRGINCYSRKGCSIHL